MEFEDPEVRYGLDTVLKWTSRVRTFRGVNPDTGEFAAVKVLAISDHDQVGSLSRVFLDRCEILSQLDHPALPTLLEAGLTEKGDAFLAFDWTEGKTAQELSPLPPSEALPLMVQALEGLECLALHNLVHWNLTPGNLRIFESSDGHRSCHLVGLGVGLLPSEWWPTHRSNNEGEEEWVAPELLKLGSGARSPALGGAWWRSDLYSLAAVTSHLLGATVTDAGSDEPNVETVPGIRTELHSMLEACLRGNANDRPPSFSMVSKVFQHSQPRGGRHEVRSTRSYEFDQVSGTLRLPADLANNDRVEEGSEDGGSEEVGSEDVTQITKLPPVTTAPIDVEPTEDSDDPLAERDAVLEPDDKTAIIQLQPDTAPEDETEVVLTGATQGVADGPRMPGRSDVTAKSSDEDGESPDVDSKSSEVGSDKTLPFDRERVRPVPAEMAPATPEADEKGEPDPTEVLPPAYEDVMARARELRQSMLGKAALLGVDPDKTLVMSRRPARRATNPPQPAQAGATEMPPVPGSESDGAKKSLSRMLEKPGSMRPERVPPASTAAEAPTGPVLGPKQVAQQEPEPVVQETGPATTATATSSRTESSKLEQPLGPAERPGLRAIIALLVLGFAVLSAWFLLQMLRGNDDPPPVEEATLPAAVAAPEVPLEPEPDPEPVEEVAVLHEGLELALEALAQGDLEQARELADEVRNSGDEVALSEASCDALAVIDETVARIENQERLEALRVALETADERALRRALRGASRQSGLMREPGAAEVVADGRAVIGRLEKIENAIVASEFQDALAQAGDLARLHPAFERAGDHRNRAAMGIERRVDELARSGRVEEAETLLGTIEAAWPERGGLDVRKSRLTQTARSRDSFRSLLEEAEGLAQQKKFQAALDLLASAEAPFEWVNQIADLQESVKERFAQADRLPPSISLGGGDPPMVRRGQPVAVLFRASDDFEVKEFNVWARSTASTEYRKVAAERLSEDTWRIELAPSFHADRAVELYAQVKDHHDHEARLASAEQPLEIRRRRWYRSR